MADNVVRLENSNERLPVKACGSCRHYRIDSWGASSADCVAASRHAATARIDECRDGRLWEPKLPPVPVLVRFKRWLIG